jgi:cytidine deaminase
MTEDSAIIYGHLKDLLSRGHAPYSNFLVAAAVVDETGNVHYGVNVENQSYPVGTCAEAGAIAALRTAGGKQIKKLYLLSDPNIRVVPCGACRQRLTELGSSDTTVVTFGPKGEEFSYAMEELLPNSFRFK